MCWIFHVSNQPPYFVTQNTTRIIKHLAHKFCVASNITILLSGRGCPVIHEHRHCRHTVHSVSGNVHCTHILLFFFLWRCDPTRVMASSFLMFLDHTQRRSTVGRTPLEEWSARHRDLYLTTHDTHNRQTSMFPVGFEPTISAGERSQTYALDSAATGTGTHILWLYQ